jgi:predicted amidohydrolase YtcJ
LVFAGLLSSLVGCSEQTQDGEASETRQTLAGEALYRERIMLPPGAELHVTLEDVSKMDVPSTVIASSRHPLTGAPPYAFKLEYSDTSIEPRMRYSLRAKIMLGDNLLFTSTEQLNPFRQPEEDIVIMLTKVGAGTAQQHSTHSADAVYFNGKIITVDDDNPKATAVAIKDGMIIYVGDIRGSKPLMADSTRQIDLQGKTMVPGFVDAHGHVVSAGIQAASANLLPMPDGEVNSFGQLVDTLKAWEATAKGAEFIENTGWLVGFGFDDSQLEEQAFPTAEVLEQVSRDKPMMIIHQSGHFGVFNRKALELAGITDCRKEVPGGSIRCKADGQTPSGVLEENAFFGALAVFQASVDDAYNLDLFGQGMRNFARFGYTTAQEGRAFAPTVATAEAKAAQGPLLIDVALYVDYTSKDLLDTSAYYSGSGYDGIGYNNGLRIAGLKLTIDGSPQGKTAWLSQPYFVPPEGQDKDYAGYAAMTEEQVNAEVMDAFANNRQVLVHCNGDAAIDRYLNAIEQAIEEHGLKDRRNVLIHGQTLRKDQIGRVKELDVMPSLFPMHTFYWGDWHRDSVLGPERAAYISPTRDVLDAGMVFSSHHDAPVANPDSMRVLSATVTRVTRSGEVLGPDQRVTPYEGLKAITIWPAYQHFEEKVKGSIEVGKQADFVILSADPLTVDPLTIADIKVLQTINDGQTVFKHPDGVQKSELVGGDRDEHGCIPSAGYQWCEKLGECVRPWELEKSDISEEAGEVDFASYCRSD